VGVRRFTDLDAWKLANELKVGIYALLTRPNVERDVEFRNQLRNSAASAPRNIAEGFGRFGPREFSQYLRVANGSLTETSNHLHDGVDRGYFTDTDTEPLHVLARRASAATTRLIRYLAHAKPPR
jgi:four helix bundle protein